MTTWSAPRTFDLGDLRLGVAAAATQVEGGDRANSWYDFAQQPGRIKDGSSPLRATDHWHRWREDTDLMAELGLQLYRTSVEWARVEPAPGVIDHAVLDRYREELGAVREAGLEPLVTLHHFTNPSWLEAKGAWLQPAAVDRWLAFVDAVVRALGDLVTEWTTINEPNVYATMGYVFGEFPPGRRGRLDQARRAMRNLALAHCRAYELIHRRQPHTRVGFAHHVRPFTPLDPGRRVQRRLAAVQEHLFQGALTEAMLGGSFGPFLGPQPREVTRGGRHHDYIGINYYTRTAVRGVGDERFPDVPVNDLDWEIYPPGLVEVVAPLVERYPGPVWVTENGTADSGDAFRARYLHEHLATMVTSGLPFERYYHWCFVDNWEWAEGEVPRFGLVHLDWASQERTVKESGRFYAEMIAAGGVTEELYETYVAPQHYRIG